MTTRAQTAALAKEIASHQPVPDWESIPELKKWKQQIEIRGEKKTLTFDQMVSKYKDLDAEIEYRKNQQVALKESIESAVLVSGEEKVLCEGYRVARITKRGSRKIVAEKLLEKGVSAQTIAECTEIGKEVSYVEIKKAKAAHE